MTTRRERRDFITATELELLACFGVEPTLLDAGIPWCFNEATYAVEVDGIAVTFTVAPSCRDIRLTAKRGDRPLYELAAIQIEDVEVIDEHGRDALVFRLSDDENLEVQLRPTFCIRHHWERNTP